MFFKEPGELKATHQSRLDNSEVAIEAADREEAEKLVARICPIKLAEYDLTKSILPLIPLNEHPELSIKVLDLLDYLSLFSKTMHNSETKRAKEIGTMVFDKDD